MSGGPGPARPRPCSASRRQALQRLGLLPALLGRGAPAGAAAAFLAGCAPPPPPLLRIGAHPWLGYELMYLARHRHHISGDAVRLVEVPTAPASLRALSAGTLEGAGLTLDEVLSARARGLPLQVVAVFDVSNGADVLLGAPGLDTLAQLKGLRVGVEQSATGALMLDAALQRAGLQADDVRLVPMAYNEHARAFHGNRVDALVTFEPVCSQLVRQGARRLFSSAEAPGLIVDVLAVRADVADTHGPGLQALVAGLFGARADWLRDPAAHAPLIAPRLRLAPDEVVLAFGGLDLPDLATNRRWLDGPTPALLDSALKLATVMRRAALLAPQAGLSASAADAVAAPLVNPRFLPAA